jgi:NADH dehydrogenase
VKDVQMRQRPRVVIVGGGFGGLSAAKGLARQPFEVALIDRNNHHLFQPLLYQVATAGLSPADIASPIRNILSAQRNAKVMLAEVSGIDLAAREVVADGLRLSYDYLVLATGARHAYFGHDDWAAVAPGLKSVDDATYLRRRILLAFVLVEAAPRILTPFTEALSEAARRSLEQLGVDVRLGQAVNECSCESVRIGSESIPTRTIIWAAGVMASPAGRWLGAEMDRAGRVKVGADLSVPGYPDVFVIGDTASAIGANGAPLPGVAPVAKQQGEYVARALVARNAGRSIEAFRYRDFGSLATIGRKRAVAQMGRLSLSGLVAWLLWSAAHIYFLIGFRNRFTVILNWLWSYVTFQRGSRLITGLHARPLDDMTRMPRMKMASRQS